MQQKNLDTLKSEINDYLKATDFVVFHGYARGLIERPAVDWDVSRYPDFRDFLAVGRQLGIRLIVFHHREFSAAVVDRAIEELQDSSYEYEEQRDIERRLRELRVYDGFTCAIELSFEHQDITYFYEIRTEWYTELNNLLEELDMFPDDEEDEDENPLSGYYSKN
jgi:hypothetical protein